ncbi:MAG: hypothetical protein LBQ20_07005 [Rhodanobacter sp.]|jgi:hypothetical protein|nr:hypothetical protein [Rhodanobacter sp.]
MLPSPLNEFLVITVLDDAEPFFGDLFRRKFGDPIPDFPCHLGVFYRAPAGQFMPLSYLHFTPFGDIMLVGGLCTDGGVFAQMSGEQREQIHAAGGVMVHALRHTFERLADECDAFFGYCGDARAWEVDMQAGFEPTEYDKLIVRWHKALDPVRRRSLVAKAHAIGPF